MDKEQSKEVLEKIYHYYPNFNKHGSDRFNLTWMNALMKCDYKKTLRKLDNYAFDNPYPPALADVAVKIVKPKDDGMAQQIKEAEDNVKKEKADPVKAKERERLLNEMREKWGAANDS